jgi:two-component system heavy metal sensor histidine kinase CusS|tara:strand:+ start:1201 stop:2751 length:1551 start_codon:yes stop_codon:yes gene_type:complete
MMGFRQSFRFRIIALTILVSGTVLLAFGLASRYALYLIKIDTVDQNLATRPLPGFPDPRDTENWKRMFEAVDQVSNKLYEGDIYLIVYGAEKEEYFRSEYWPGRLTLDSFPEVEGELRGMRVSESDFNPERWLDSRRRRGNPQFGPGPGPRFEGKPPDEIRRGGGERGRFQVPEPILFTRSSRDGPIRFGVFQFPGFNVTLGVELGGVAKEMEHARNAFIFSLPLALAVLAFGAWLIASRAIKPIRKLTDTAGGMSAAKLDERIEQGDEDREFSELIQVFNGMLERLERSFHQATRFSADAAHELKTPLTILQGHLELALQEAPDDSDQQRRLGMLLDETQRLRGITRRLLLLAQADAGQLSVKGKPIRLAGLVQEMIEDYEMQSPGIRFSTTIDDASAVGDRSFLTQILQNLLSNASKYNDDESPWIDVTCESLENEIRIDISNGGAGIPESNQDCLFNRFTRVDSARNREVDGFGLGLNLSREFARAMQGELALLESSSDRTCFRLTLPLGGER